MVGFLAPLIPILQQQALRGLLSAGIRNLPSTIVRQAGKQKPKQMGNVTVEGSPVASSVASSVSPTGLKDVIRAIANNKRVRQIGLLSTGVGLGTLFGNDSPPSEPTPETDDSPPLALSPTEDLGFGQIFFPNVGGTASNKNLIDAAILRASLELLKPRQPGENFASQAARALEAGQDVAGSGQSQIYATAQQALAAGQAAGFSQVSVYPKGNGFSYTGKVGIEPLNAQLINMLKPKEEGKEVKNLKIITPQVIEDFKNDPENAGFSDEQIIQGLKELGYTEGT